MKISEYYSVKIAILSFVLIVMVVYIHSFYLEATDYPYANAVQIFVSNLASGAVPLFYAISGFLFFNGMTKINECIPKIKRRVGSLLVPYLIWNLIFVGYYLVLGLFPSVSMFVNSDILSNIDLSHPIATFQILFINPVAFHLWFLRDLIVFVFASPLLYLMIKHYKWVGLLAVYVATGWITRFWLFYFILGGIIALHFSLEDTRINRRWVIVACAVFIGCSLAKMLYGDISNQVISNYVSYISTFIGVIAIWGGYDLYLKKRRLLYRNILGLLTSYTFFIYLFIS